MNILFVHNTWNRTITIENSIKIEKEFFPNSKHLILYNNKDLKFKEQENVNYFYFGKNDGHKLGCYNSFVYGIIESLKLDWDIFLFSHDDIYLKDINKFKDKLIIMKDFDFMSKRFTNNSKLYLMLETVIMNRNGVKKLSKVIKPVTTLLYDDRNSFSPEVQLGDIMKKISLKCFYDDFKNNSYGLNNLGYYHIENIRGWL